MHQQTSLLAWIEIQPKLGKRQSDVLNALKQRPMTNLDLARTLSLPINSITPRVMELRSKGLVEEHTKARCQQTGRLCIYWRVK